MSEWSAKQRTFSVGAGFFITIIHTLVQFAISENISHLSIKKPVFTETSRIWIKNFRETYSACKKKTFWYTKKRKHLANNHVELTVHSSLAFHHNQALSNNFIKILYANK